MPPTLKKRCGALLTGRANRKLRHRRCRRRPVAGKTRCALHGAYATGPVTAEGMARTIAAMQAGRARWLARLKAERKPIPCGRKRGGRNRTAEEREQAAHQARCERNWRRLVRETHAERKARREARRKEAAELERWRARSTVGLPWNEDDEAEALELAFAAVEAHGAGRQLERDLSRLARTFVEQLGSQRPPPAATVERVFRNLTRFAKASGCDRGKPAWLEHVQQAFARWRSRLMVDAVIERVRAIRSAP